MTLLIVLLWFNIVHYSSLFQYFLSMCYGPYSTWKFQNFLCTCLLTFFENIIMTVVNPRIPHLNIYATFPSYILKSEVSITLHCQLCSTCYTAFRIKNCSKSTSTIHTYRKKLNRMPQLYQLSSEKGSIHYLSLSAMFNPLCNSTNQELFEKHFCNQNTYHDKYGRFPLWREAITWYRQIDTFRCQQRWIGHKGGYW